MVRVPPRALLALALSLLPLFPRPAAAASFLYATASRAGRVDTFPLDSDGGILERQSTIGTRSPQPRRLVVDRRSDGTSCTLYAAEIDRVEAFRIRPDGNLRSIGVTESEPDAELRDIAIGPDSAAPAFLYVPQIKPSRVAAYPILHDGSRNDGAPADTFTSCVQGREFTTYQSITIANGLIYVGTVSPGRIEAYLPSPNGIAGKVCPEQNPGRLSQGPGTAAALATELNPNNTQCHPDPREKEQFPVVTPATDTEAAKTVTSFLHVDPDDTGTSTDEQIFLKCRRQCLNGETPGKNCPACPTGADICTNSKGDACLTPRIYYTCPDQFTPDNCKPGSRIDYDKNDPNKVNRASCPVTHRRDVGEGAQGIVVSGERAFFVQKDRNLTAHQLVDGGAFQPFLCQPDALKDTKRADLPPCTDPAMIAALVDPASGLRSNVGQVKEKRIRQVAPSSKFSADSQLSSVWFDPDHERLFTPHFYKGFVSTYSVKGSNDRGPKVEHVVGGDTNADLRSSPFRVTVNRNVLYVGAGSFDRVQAYRLTEGTPAPTPFSFRDVPDGSFPNDVVVAVPGADCPD